MGLNILAWAKSKKYTDNAVSQSAGLHREIVNSLPITGDEKVIYMVPVTGSGDDNYNEYMWINGTYELIGNTRVDLTDYYNKTQIDAALSGKANAATSIAGYGITDAYTKTEVETMLGGLLVEESYSNTSKITVAAGGSSTYKVDVTKSGYTPICISGVYDVSGSQLSIKDSYIGISGSGNYISTIRFINDTDATITVNANRIELTILYVKNY